MINNYLIHIENLTNLLLWTFSLFYILALLMFFLIRKHKREWWNDDKLGKRLEKNLFKDPLSGWFSVLGVVPSVIAIYFFVLSLCSQDHWEISAAFAVSGTLLFCLSEIRLWRVEASKMHRLSYLPRLLFYKDSLGKLYIKNFGGGSALNLNLKIGGKPTGLTDLKKDFFEPTDDPILIPEADRTQLPYEAEVHFRSPQELRYDFYTKQLISEKITKIIGLSWSEGMEKNGEKEIETYLDELAKAEEETRRQLENSTNH